MALLQTLWRDEALWFVDKPSGLLVHRGWGHDDVVALDLLRQGAAGDVYPLHRLDRQTSGVLAVALTGAGARAISEQLATGAVDKRYLALVRGQPPDEGEVDHPLPRGEGGARVEARSRYRRLATLEAAPRAVSLVEVCPLTGRTHQVRRHMKHLGHPLIGDANWGRGELNRAFRERYGLQRLALHARSFTCQYPIGARLEVTAPLPADLVVPLARIGFDLEALGLA